MIHRCKCFAQTLHLPAFPRAQPMEDNQISQWIVSTPRQSHTSGNIHHRNHSYKKRIKAKFRRPKERKRRNRRRGREDVHRSDLAAFMVAAQNCEPGQSWKKEHAKSITDLEIEAWGTLKVKQSLQKNNLIKMYVHFIRLMHSTPVHIVAHK